MQQAPIRTITLGLAEQHPLTAATIQRAQRTLQQASARFTAAGYDVQTVRLSTRPLFEDLSHRSTAEVIAYGLELQRMLDDVGLQFCSIGPVQAMTSPNAIEQLDLVADILIATSALNATVQLATTQHGMRAEAALATARLIQRLARETEEGFGNFRFAMLACVEPGCPFFPAAYHAGPSSIALGLQGASILTEALRAHAPEDGQAVGLAAITQWVREEIIASARPLVDVGKAVAQEQDLLFRGIDLSPAPMAADSIVSAMELCGYGDLGSPGTLAVAGALTTALKTTNLPTCGYCGLMLPVLEDALLGERWERGQVDIPQLLLYSAVCGTGLDTIPLSGESSPGRLAHLFLDVATMALRLQKPLSARLFPVPGARAGEHTTFTSPYLTNTIVK